MGVQALVVIGTVVFDKDDKDVEKIILDKQVTFAADDGRLWIWSRARSLSEAQQESIQKWLDGVPPERFYWSSSNGAVVERGGLLKHELLDMLYPFGCRDMLVAVSKADPRHDEVLPRFRQ